MLQHDSINVEASDTSKTKINGVEYLVILFIESKSIYSLVSLDNILHLHEYMFWQIW